MERPPSGPITSTAGDKDGGALQKEAREAALLDLLRHLDAARYVFVPPTPATHARVVARPERRRADSLRDVLGWSLPFAPGTIDAEVERLLRQAGALDVTSEGLHRSRLRVARVRDQLFLHSAYPTEAADSVFLGPDTYRFVDFITLELSNVGVIHRILDIGTGSGVGGVIAGLQRPEAQVLLSDINPAALRLARINALHAGLDVETSCCGGLADVEGSIEVALANPPFIVDPSQRAYRDGGGMHGARLSLDWTLDVAKRLEPGGRMLLYTGVAIVDGGDPLRDALQRELPGLGCDLDYRELDPDIFGEELDTPAYADVERIAAVGAVIVRRG